MSVFEWFKDVFSGDDTFKPSSLPKNPIIDVGPIDVARYWDVHSPELLQPINFLDIPEITVTGKYVEPLSWWALNVSPHLPGWLGGPDTTSTSGSSAGAGAPQEKRAQMATVVGVLALGAGAYFIWKGAK